MCVNKRQEVLGFTPYRAGPSWPLWFLLIRQLAVLS